MSGQIQAWVVGLQFAAVSRDWNHCHTPPNANSKCNSTGSSTGIFQSAASSSKLVWKPGGNEQPRAVCGCTLLWEVNHSRGFISLRFSPGSLVIITTFDIATHHFYYLLNIWNANWWKHFYCLEMLLLGGVHFDYYEKMQCFAFSDTQCSVWGWTNTSKCSGQILFALGHTLVNYWQHSELEYLFWGFILCSSAAFRQDKILLWSSLFTLHRGDTQWLRPFTKMTMQPRHCKHLVTKLLLWNFSKNKKTSQKQEWCSHSVPAVLRERHSFPRHPISSGGWGGGGLVSDSPMSPLTTFL